MARLDASSKTINFRDLYNKKYGDAIVNRRNKYTPEQLWEHAVAYFTWAESNAIKSAESVAHQGDLSEHRTHKTRVFSLNGFRLFCSISGSSWEWCKSNPDYAEVIEMVTTVIHEQKYQLAVNNIINASLVGKELGIDKPQEITISNNSSANDVDTMKEALESVISKL